MRILPHARSLITTAPVRNSVANTGKMQFFEVCESISRPDYFLNAFRSSQKLAGYLDKLYERFGVPSSTTDEEPINIRDFCIGAEVLMVDATAK